MWRFAETELARWNKSTDRKPLIVRGARQVGKTWTIREFGRSNYSGTILLDLERDATARAIFDGDLAASTLVPQIEAIGGHTLANGQTLLFIDEIQARPRALTALRYLYEERPDIHVIAAGSALEFALGEYSFPVGRVTFLRMHPMTFHEFLVARGLDSLAGSLPKLGEPHKAFESIHMRALRELRTYMLVGGMPAAVWAFLREGTLAAAAQVHADLALSLAGSLGRYQPNRNRESLEAVFSRLPGAVGGQVVYAHIDPGVRTETTRASVQALARALLVTPVRDAAADRLPLGAQANDKRFKPLFLDVGLLQYLLGVNAAEVLSDADLTAVHRGAVTEQFVGQELLAAGGSENGSMYYWSRAGQRGNAEVDFVMARGGKIYPIEVKSGAAGRMRSAALFLEAHPSSPVALVFSGQASAKRSEGRLLYVPLYTRFDDSGLVVE